MNLVDKESGTARSYYKANDKISIKTLKLKWEKLDISRGMIKISKKFTSKKAEKNHWFRCQVSEFSYFSARIMLTIYLFPIYQTVSPSGSEWHNALKCT